MLVQGSCNDFRRRQNRRIKAISAIVMPAALITATSMTRRNTAASLRQFNEFGKPGTRLLVAHGPPLAPGRQR